MYFVKVMSIYFKVFSKSSRQFVLNVHIQELKNEKTVLHILNLRAKPIEDSYAIHIRISC